MASVQADINPGDDQEKFYNVYKTELRNENDTLNQRVIWNIFAQAGLFGAYAAVLNAPKEGKTPLFAGMQDILFWALPGMSFMIALLTLPVIMASILYMQRLRRVFFDKMGEAPEGLPPVMGRPKNSFLTQIADLAPLIIPMVIVVTWLTLIIAQIYMGQAS